MKVEVDILKNWPTVEEFEGVEQRYSKMYDDCFRCGKTPHSSKTSLKSSNREPKLSPITSTKSESSRSSRFLKRKELKKNVELEKLMSGRTVTCDHTLPPLYSDAVKEGMIHLLVGSYVKKPDSGFFSDWSRNNAYETLHSYWLSYFNLISGQKVGLARRKQNSETARF